MKSKRKGGLEVLILLIRFAQCASLSFFFIPSLSDKSTRIHLVQAVCDCASKWSNLITTLLCSYLKLKKYNNPKPKEDTHCLVLQVARWHQQNDHGDLMSNANAAWHWPQQEEEKFRQEVHLQPQPVRSVHCLALCMAPSPWLRISLDCTCRNQCKSLHTINWRKYGSATSNLQHKFNYA